MNKPYSIDFRAPETASELSSYIGLDAKLFKKVISSATRREFYQAERIVKRSPHRENKFRDIWNVKYSILAEAHKTITRRFELFARLADPRFPHESAYGYIRNRGTRENAKVHCGAPLLLRADLRNFFPSISIDRLRKRFLELGMQSEAAFALAKFVTVDDVLPLGLNASPMLANLVCVDLDIKLQKLAQAYGCKATRYADDISISGKRSLPSRAELEKIIESEGFQLSNEKFRVTKLGQAHYVTGLSISDENIPHAPRNMKRRLRQELYYCKKYGIPNHLGRLGYDYIQGGINRIDGTVHYVSHIETENSEKIKSLWNALLEKDHVEASYDTLISRSVRSVSCFVDETEIVFKKKKYLALGLVFSEDPAALLTSTVSILREHEVGDAFYAGDKDALKKKGLHFVDSHPDLRTAYIKALAGLPYRTFIVFGELKGDEEYKKTYLSLLEKILPKRLMWYDGADISFLFEENSKIKISSLKKVVGDVYGELEKSKNRRPIKAPDVKFGKKLEVQCFAVPDYLLAVFSRFAQFNEKPEEMRRHQFERLRDKYRLIVDADTGMEYSRRRPFHPWVVTSI